MIILEGPDGGGKTTLLKELAETHSFLSIAERAVSSHGEGLRDIRGYVEKHLQLGYRDILLDRFALISGPIYGTLTDLAPPNDAFKDLGWVVYAESMLLHVRPLIIYCLPPLHTVFDNIEKDEPSQGVLADDQAVVSIYWQYRARAARDVATGLGMIYDYTSHVNGQKKLIRARIDLKRRSMT